MNIANRYGLTGYATNLDNGNVEVQVQGNGVDEFLKESIQGDRFVKVYNYSVKELKIVEDERTFKII